MQSHQQRRARTSGPDPHLPSGSAWPPRTLQGLNVTPDQRLQQPYDWLMLPKCRDQVRAWIGQLAAELCIVEFCSPPSPHPQCSQSSTSPC